MIENSACQNVLHTMPSCRLTLNFTQASFSFTTWIWLFLHTELSYNNGTCEMLKDLYLPSYQNEKWRCMNYVMNIWTEITETAEKHCKTHNDKKNKIKKICGLSILRKWPWLWSIMQNWNIHKWHLILWLANYSAKTNQLAAIL